MDLLLPEAIIQNSGKKDGFEKSRYMKQGEPVTLVRKHYLDKIKPMRFVNYDGKAKSIKSYQFAGQFKNSKVPLKFVILFGPYGKKDQKNVHILLTNRAMLSAQKTVTLYRLRWGIESCYRMTALIIWRETAILNRIEFIGPQDSTMRIYQSTVE